MTDAATKNGRVNQDGMIFEILKTSAEGVTAARLGRLVFPKRKPLETPNFIAIASRGVIPHITPDNLAKHTSFGAAYMALEDCKSSVVEKKKPAALSIPSSPGKRPLNNFTGLPESIATVLAARRNPAIKTPVGNGAKFIAIFTSTGFRNITIDEYYSAVETLRPNVVIGPADLFHTSTMPPSKKLVRMAGRTEDWTDIFLNPERQETLKKAGVSVFAPVLAVPNHFQWEHLSNLANDMVDSLSGLAIYDVDLLPDIEENYKPLVPLPRLSLHIPETPQAILRQVSLGVDICTIPFLNAISDAGVALTFTFPPRDGGIQPLGIDMWLPEHEILLKPLAEGCQCYACTTHHRAYIHHLLNAKEMLGWTLLQIHNQQVMTDFFTGIRAAIQTGAEIFEKESEIFVAAYEAELPQGTGTRPRARGYHFKGEANPCKINPPTWQNFSEVGSDSGGDAAVLEAQATGDGTETPIVPEDSSSNLQEKGFGEVTDKKPRC